MSELSVDTKVRLKAAARVLEKTASRVKDYELKSQLLKLASNLRMVAEGNVSALRDVEVAYARAKSIDDIINEIREWIWKGEKEYRQEANVEASEARLLKRVLKPLEEFERILENIDRKLEELLP